MSEEINFLNWKTISKMNGIWKLVGLVKKCKTSEYPQPFMHNIFDSGGLVGVPDDAKCVS